MSDRYLISYDLKEGQDYSSLIKAIKSFDGYVKVTESCWCIGATQTCSEIRDNLDEYLVSGDKLLVVKVTHASWASHGLEKGTNSWLKRNL